MSGALHARAAYDESKACAPVIRPAVALVPATGGDPYYLKALADECATVAAAVNGTRNHTLNTSAIKIGGYVAAGMLDDQTARDALALADGGLNHKATDATIQSAFAAATPRVKPPLPDLDQAVAGWLREASTSTAADQGDSIEGEEEHTSWFPVPIDAIIAGRDTAAPAPVFLARQDGHRLFYAAKINGLIGESESGKTWVALHTTQRALAEGCRVLYVDFEDTPQTIIGRLRSLNATDEHLTLFAYMRPDEPLQRPEALADLDATLTDRKAALVVLDGFNEAMTMLGLEPLSNSDVTRFGQFLLRRITKTGAAVLTIDHTGKTPGGKGALGAQAKRAIVDGCSLRVDAVKPFGRGQTGRLRLTIDKDRPGHVRGCSTGGHAGTVVLAAQDGDDLIDVTVEQPGVGTAGADTFRPTALMERTSRWVEQSSAPQTSNAIRGAVGSRAVHARLALALLVTEGYVSAEDRPGVGRLHSHIRPYKQASDPESDVFIGRDA